MKGILFNTTVNLIGNIIIYTSSIMIFFMMMAKQGGRRLKLVSINTNKR